MKQLILLFSIAFLSNFKGYSQNIQPLSIREAYDFNVNDTFQYAISLNPRIVSSYPPPSKLRQVVILSKQMDTVKKQVTYTTSVEEYTPSYITGRTLVEPTYSKKIPEIVVIKNLDSILNAQGKCSVISNPTFSNYCYDSTVLAYGNRKTLKHDYNYGFSTLGKEHYAAGLGSTLNFKDGEAEFSYSLFEMLFYNKQGQTWGTRSSIFDEQKVVCKPLTVREVFDFNVNDIFIYKNLTYDFPLGRYDTIYEKHTILYRQPNSMDSIVYFIKKESFYTSAANKLIVKTDTLVVKDLDSSAVYKLRTNSPFYTQDWCKILNNSTRLIIGRQLGGGIDFCQSYFVGAGVGLYSSYSCSFTPDDKNLMYFKKGAEIWGSLINFPTSLFTPTLPDFKITLYPNPTTDKLTIESETLFDDIKITSLEGKTLYEEKVMNALQYTIKMSYMPNGLYHLELYKGQILRGVKKFVVQH